VTNISARSGESTLRASLRLKSRMTAYATVLLALATTALIWRTRPAATGRGTACGVASSSCPS
jgi:hypothetical protein